jgi:hypothetical protein
VANSNAFHAAVMPLALVMDANKMFVRYVFHSTIENSAVENITDKIVLFI